MDSESTVAARSATGGAGSGGGTRAGSGRRSKARGRNGRALKVLVLSHMHPEVSRGGAEIAAHQMFRQLNKMDGIEATFVAASGGRVSERMGVRFAQPFGPDEYVYCSGAFDHFSHSNPDPLFAREFGRLMSEIKPDVVHFHHYTNFGVEALFQVRRFVPEAKVIVTLHEYLAICNHFGQMVTRPGFALCEKADQRKCARCFPERSEADFFLRNAYIKRFFRLVDHFISPSKFLAMRYVDWGLPAESVSVIENGVPEAAEGADTSPSGSQERPLTLGFFGQISRLKGTGVVLEAAKLLDRDGEPAVRFDIHGDYSGQPPEFQREFEDWLDHAPPSVRFFGPYQHTRVRDLMQTVDAVLVPSVWWENSPLVIQEAMVARRPLIVSNIGGMAEKVRDGLDGFHFRVGDARSLSALIQTLAAEPKRLHNLQRTLAVPPTLNQTATAIVDLYRRLLKSSSVQAAGGWAGG